jgi:hypothetical protein
MTPEEKKTTELSPEEIRNDFISLLSREINENKSLIQELTSALKEAKQLTRGYVFLHFGTETKEEWKSIQHFQPMKRINSAIQKGESYGKI